MYQYIVGNLQSRFIREHYLHYRCCFNKYIILEDRTKWSTCVTCSHLCSAHRPQALVLRTRGLCDFIDSNNVLTNQKQKAVITVLLIDIFVDTEYIKQRDINLRKQNCLVLILSISERCVGLLQKGGKHLRIYR